MLTSLSISLFYAHEEAGTWSLLDLSKGRGVIAPDDLGADAFLHAAGGIRFDHDRFHTFLRTCAAGDLESYVYFLLGSLATLSTSQLPDELEKLRSDGTFMDETDVVAAVMGEDQSRIVLRRKGNALELAHLDPNGKAPADRLSPYFDGVEIPIALWRREAATALEELFAVGAQRAKGQSETRLGKLVTYWKGHKGKLTT
jgi:hypothetical protein